MANRIGLGKDTVACASEVVDAAEGLDARMDCARGSVPGRDVVVTGERRSASRSRRSLYGLRQTFGAGWYRWTGRWPQKP
jgi:hypothetical protein